jgi:hypothetical protein
VAKVKVTRLFVIAAICTLASLVGIPALSADTWWSDEIIRLLSTHQATVPGENVGPYLRKMHEVRRALIRNDDRTVQTELDTMFQMLIMRRHGLSDTTARELFNILAILTPLKEYGVTVPDPEFDRQ